MITKLLVATGVVSLIIFVGILIVILIALIREKYAKLKWEHTYKHRFDRKPTAKCYCKDCKNWNSETGECYDHCNSRRMADDWFCCFATPKDKEN